MLITAIIALRNVIVNRRRSFLIGLVIFLAAFLLLASSAMVNGVERQINKSYDNIQAANVVVIWESLKEIEIKDAQRFLFLQPNGFESEKDAENKKAIERLDAFLKEHKAEVERYERLVRRNAQLMIENDVDAQFSVYGLTKEFSQFLEDSKTVTMLEGVLYSAESNAIAISQEKVTDHGLSLGEKITVMATTPEGEVRSVDFVIRGIYENGAGWDNWYGFMSNENAAKLFEYKDGYFDLGKIYLKDPKQAVDFAGKLDAALTGGSNVLRAEAGSQASTVYPTTALTLKAAFNLFIFFLLFVIAMGLRSTIRMNLFARMKEFGTLRAIGYSRFQSYSIIFLEAFFLSVISLVLAFVMAAALTMYFGKVGVYMGDGPLTYFGGKYLYPNLRIGDVLFALIIIAVFATLSTFNPGLKLCFQNITDIMAKRQRPISVYGSLLRSMFGRKSGLKNRQATP